MECIENLNSLSWNKINVVSIQQMLLVFNFSKEESLPISTQPCFRGCQ